MLITPKKYYFVLFRRHTNAEEFLNEHGAEIIKDIQKNRQGEETTSMETAIEQTLQSRIPLELRASRFMF